MRTASRIVVAALAFGTAAGFANAQATSEDDAKSYPNKSYPNRTIRVIVPFPPGGPADIVAR